MVGGLNREKLGKQKSLCHAERRKEDHPCLCPDHGRVPWAGAGRKNGAGGDLKRGGAAEVQRGLALGAFSASSAPPPPHPE